MKNKKISQRIFSVIFVLALFLGTNKIIYAINYIYALKTTPATNVLSTSATLNGDVTVGTGIRFYYIFSYGRTNTYDKKLVSDSGVGTGKPMKISKLVMGLDSKASYSYQLTVKNDNGPMMEGDYQPFTTAGDPDVSVSATKNITVNSATLNGVVTPNGLYTSCYFMYGEGVNLEDAGIGKKVNCETASIGNGFTGKNVSAKITGLKSGTKYFFDIYASNSAGNTGSYSSEKNPFTTSGSAPTPTDISILTPATKLSYNVGDPLDITGLEVVGHYSDGTGQTQNITASNISGFDSSAPSTNQVLTITVSGKTTTYSVVITGTGNSNNNSGNNGNNNNNSGNNNNGTNNSNSGNNGNGANGNSNVDVSTGSITIKTNIENPLSSDIDSIPKFIEAILNIILVIGTAVVALAIIFTGFLFVKAQGNPEMITKAKKALSYTLIGAALLLGCWVLAHAIGETVNQIKG